MSAEKASPGCRVCGRIAVAEWLHPREMMFGMRDEFAYFRCADCGCLQINAVPSNLDKYYPENYYSYSAQVIAADTPERAFKRRFISPHLVRYLAGWGGGLGRVFAKIFRPPTVPPWLKFLKSRLPVGSAILDVGCGSGALLLVLRDCGFRNLRGVDPFISAPVECARGVRVDKCSIDQVQGRFELIMFHHVFEHVADPLATLQQARRLLAQGGQILIRIPLSDSTAAAKYRENWAQLDAPRHITLQTRNSMEVLAQRAGLKVTRVEYDSSEFQFWGSEQYVRDIPLQDDRSYQTNKARSIFSPEQINTFVADAARLNQEAKGDQAAFVLEEADA